jgi:hypothetical protein
MTQWSSPEGGRERGPVGLVRAWVAVVTRPRRFFRTAIAPGDQGPGVVFLAVVVGIATASRLTLSADVRPPETGSPALTAIVVVGAMALLVAPTALHLVAALQTVILVALVDERAGVSETVQVLAYASAPCVLVGVPVPAVRLGCAVYGAVLLAIGIAEVHEVSVPRAAALAAVPAVIAFGFLFGGYDAATALGVV